MCEKWNALIPHLIRSAALVPPNLAGHGRVVGYVAVGPSRGEGANESDAEVHALFVDSDKQGHGTWQTAARSRGRRVRGGRFPRGPPVGRRRRRRDAGFYESRGFTFDGGRSR